MAQFTFIELHLEEGAIPQPSVLGSSDSGLEDTESEVVEPGSGGNGLGGFLAVVFMLAIAVAIARKVRGNGDVELEDR